VPDVEGGILPPGPRARISSDSQNFCAPGTTTFFSAGLEARLYGRQDARRYNRGVELGLRVETDADIPT
jgi:hypothetical protein